ncbi:MAG TPA: polysaccharide biosynthesis C-terminal domain-containing protein [Bacteroidia bacterium]|nr:polysaccharide biosynthesis C-terminal domain-containing protein [Bacteroidia bacterium]
MGVIKRQGIKNMITGYVGMAIGFVNLIVIQPHFLTKEELGLTRLLYSFSLLIAMFVPLGIGNATIKYFPIFKDQARKHHGYFGFMNLFPLVGFLGASAVLWISKDFIFNQYRSESPLFLEYFNYIFPLIFFNSFIAVLAVYCNANYKTTIPSFLNDVVIRLLTILVVSIYFLKWLTLDQFITCFAAIYAIQMFVLVAYIFIFDKPGFKIDWKMIREKRMKDVIQYGMILWFAGIASLGLKYFDSIMLAKYMPLAFVGIYTVAAFIPTVIEAPLNALERIAGSKISFAWADNDHDQIREIYRKSSLYLFLLGGFLFLVINVNIHSMLTFLPDGYQQGEWVVLIISLGTLYNMATGLNAPVLFNSDKYKYGALFLIILAIVVIVMQMIFIPMFGIAGAAMATSLAAFIYNTLLLVSVWKFFSLQPFDTKNTRVLASIILVFAFIYSLPHLQSEFFDIIFRTILVVVLYGFLIYFQNIIPEFHRFLPWERKQKG